MPGRTANTLPVLNRLDVGEADSTALMRTSKGIINVSSEVKETDNSRKLSSNTAQSIVESPTAEPISPPKNEYTTNPPSSTITVLIISSKELSTTYSSGTSMVPMATGDARSDPGSFYNGSQVLSMPATTPGLLLPTTSGSLTNARLSHGAAYARPLPGKNQPIPVLDAVAVASFLQPDEPVPTSMPGIFQMVPGDEYSPSSSQLSSLQSLGSISTAWSISAPTSTSFVTVTRGQQWKEQAPALVETTQASSTISASLSSSMLPPSSLATSVVVATSTLLPNVAASANMNLQGASRLTPVARTLFIVFGVLGALALLAAFGIVLLMRVNKKHSATKRRHTRNWPSQSSVGSSYSATVSLSAYELAYGNSFLTENEKAFAARVETTMIKHDRNSDDPFTTKSSEYIPPFPYRDV